MLVFVTLFGALPVYGYVARRSFEGQGSIGMLARPVSGVRSQYFNTDDPRSIGYTSRSFYLVGPPP